MRTADLAKVLSAAMEILEASSSELADLDAVVGDGDLGVTVAGSTRAVRDALGALPSTASNADLVKSVASTLATANPSTLSTLTAAGLRSAGRTLPDGHDLGTEDWLAFAAAVAAEIARLGKSVPGTRPFSTRCCRASTARATARTPRVRSSSA